MPRQLQPNVPSPGEENQIRKHYYLDRYVIVSPMRGLRPDTYSRHDMPHKVASAKCPFCRNKEAALYTRPAGGAWNVRVVPNAYPAVSMQSPQAYGAHEVIIETADHDREFSELSHDERLDVLAAYRHRLNALNATPGIRYVLVWKNDGPLSGASIPHAHSQVIALPLVPPAAETDSQALNHYQAQYGRCAICDIMHWEEQKTVRIVYSDKHWLAIAPYAGSSPFGVWIIPRRHESQFTQLKPAELDSLATVLGRLSARLDSASISFNWFLQNSLPHQDHHFIMKIEPRGTPWAGVEMGTGIAINPVPPEYAAMWYNGKAE